MLRSTLSLSKGRGVNRSRVSRTARRQGNHHIVHLATKLSFVVFVFFVITLASSN